MEENKNENTPIKDVKEKKILILRLLLIQACITLKIKIWFW